MYLGCLHLRKFAYSPRPMRRNFIIYVCVPTKRTDEKEKTKARRVPTQKISYPLVGIIL